MYRLIFIVVFALTGVAAWCVLSDSQSTATAQSELPSDEPSDQKVEPIMRAKLDAAKDILEGLTLEDHEKVKIAASQLRSLSLEAGWKVIQTERYKFESEEFRRTCESVVEAAENGDTGRVALGYISMTVRCVECHDYMRKRAAGLEGAKGQR